MSDRPDDDTLRGGAGGAPTSRNTAKQKSPPSTSKKLTFEEALDHPEIFNYFDTADFGEKYDPSHTTGWGVLQGVVKKQFIPDSINNSGPFRAICIEVVDDGTGLQTPDAIPFEPGSPEAQITQLTDIKIEPRCRIRARVPGIDTYPKPIGALSGKPTKAQLDIIRMHTVFTAEKKMAAPQVGDLIYVDWRFKPKNGPMKDPIYLGRVNDMAGLSMEAIMEAIAAFMEACLGANAGDINSTGNPMSIPADTKFSPSGRIIIPPSIWDNEKSRYIYYLYEKQIKAENNVGKLQEYWSQDNLKKAMIYAANECGLKAKNSWIPWGVLYGESGFKPVGCHGNDPNVAIKDGYNTGYGMGQFSKEKYNSLAKSKQGKSFLKDYKHEDLLDPYASLLSVAIYYKRLFDQFGTETPTNKALGEWWVCPGQTKKGKT